MKTTILFNSSSTGSSDGSTYFFEMPKSNRGVAHFKLGTTSGGSGSSTAIGKIQGRLSDLVDWVDIDLSGSTSSTLESSADNHTYQDIQMYPQMRASVDSNGFTSANFTVYVSN